MCNVKKNQDIFTHMAVIYTADSSFAVSVCFHFAPPVMKKHASFTECIVYTLNVYALNKLIFLVLTHRFYSLV